MNTGLHRGKTTLVLVPALMLDKKKKGSKIKWLIQVILISFYAHAHTLETRRERSLFLSHLSFTYKGVKSSPKSLRAVTSYILIDLNCETNCKQTGTTSEPNNEEGNVTEIRNSDYRNPSRCKE